MNGSHKFADDFNMGWSCFYINFIPNVSEKLNLWKQWQPMLKKSVSFFRKMGVRITKTFGKGKNIGFYLFGCFKFFHTIVLVKTVSGPMLCQIEFYLFENQVSSNFYNFVDFRHISFRILSIVLGEMHHALYW